MARTVTPQGRGSIVVNDSGQHYVVISKPADPLTGKRHRPWYRVEPNTPEAAQKLLAKKLTELDADRLIDPSDQTVADYADRWLESRRHDVRPNTLSGYRHKVDRQIRPRLGRLRMQRVTPNDVVRFYGLLVDEDGLSPTTVRHVHTILGRMMRDAVRAGIIDRNPVADVDPPRPRATTSSERPTERAFDRDQLIRLLTTTKGDRLGPLWHLLATTGLRREEALGLLWPNVDLDRSKLVVAWVRTLAGYEPVEQEPKTKRSRRVVELDPGTVEALTVERDRQREEATGAAWHGHRACARYGHAQGDHVFTDEVGRPYHPGRVSKAFPRALQAAGLPPRRLYDLRHTHATLLLRQGVPVKVVSERLGHTSTAFTMDAYVEVGETMQRQAADVMGGLLG